jgi:hypothetical protein
MSMDIEKTQLRSFYLELSILFLRNFHDTPNRASAKFTKTFGVSVCDNTTRRYDCQPLVVAGKVLDEVPTDR